MLLRAAVTTTKSEGIMQLTGRKMPKTSSELVSPIGNSEKKNFDARAVSNGVKRTQEIPLYNNRQERDRTARNPRKETRSVKLTRGVHCTIEGIPLPAVIRKVSPPYMVRALFFQRWRMSSRIMETRARSPYVHLTVIPLVCVRTPLYTLACPRGICSVTSPA